MVLPCLISIFLFNDAQQKPKQEVIQSKSQNEHKNNHNHNTTKKLCINENDKQTSKCQFGASQNKTDLVRYCHDNINNSMQQQSQQTLTDHKENNDYYSSDEELQIQHKKKKLHEQDKTNNIELIQKLNIYKSDDTTDVFQKCNNENKVVRMEHVRIIVSDEKQTENVNVNGYQNNIRISTGPVKEIAIDNKDHTNASATDLSNDIETLTDKNMLNMCNKYSDTETSKDEHEKEKMDCNYNENKDIETINDNKCEHIQNETGNVEIIQKNYKSILYGINKTDEFDMDDIIDENKEEEFIDENKEEIAMSKHDGYICKQNAKEKKHKSSKKGLLSHIVVKTGQRQSLVYKCPTKRLKRGVTVTSDIWNKSRASEIRKKGYLLKWHKEEENAIDKGKSIDLDVID